MKKILEILFGDLEETLIIGLAMVVILTLIPVLIILLSFIIKNIIVNFSPIIMCILIMFSLFLGLLILGTLGKFILYIWNRISERMCKKHNKNNESNIF
mgnify:CR=1 FL=1